MSGTPLVKNSHPDHGVIRAFRFRFYPNLSQRKQLSREFGAARWVYNFGLSSISDAYRERGERMTWVDVSRWITEVKRDWLPWLNDTSSTTATQGLRDLDSAFQHFFRRVKNGEKPGYPSFKKKRTAQSVRYVLDQRCDNWIAGQKLVVPKLGDIANKVVWSRLPTGRPKMVTIRRDSAERWWVTVAVEEEVLPLPTVKETVGVDVGITSTVALSNGVKVPAPKNADRDKRTLARRQRTQSRRKKGSSRWKDAVLRVARVHARIKDRRCEFLQDLTKQLVRENQVLAVETLNVKGMTQNRCLARSLADASLSELIRMLEYKCRWYGRTLVKIDQWFPSSKLCSACGFKKEKLPLAVRRWRCDNCGVDHDRDLNAATNILREGLRQLREGLPKVKRVERGVTDGVVSGRAVKRESRGLVGEGLQ